MDEDRVIFRDGMTANTEVLKALWAIENATDGVTFVLTDESPGYRIEIEGRKAPDDFLSYAQRMFLLQHRDEVRRLVWYQADDSHLTGFPEPKLQPA
jgi:hypothetical protein